MPGGRFGGVGGGYRQGVRARAAAENLYEMLRCVLGYISL